MDDSAYRRRLDIDPTQWHLHLRYHDTNWLGAFPAARDELVSYDSAEDIRGQAEVAKDNAVRQGTNLMYIDALEPGDMPRLHRHTDWYLHAHFLTNDGKILPRNIRRQLLDPHASEDEAREALKGLEAYMCGQGGQMLYSAIVPPVGQGETIVFAPRR